jgi:uncharacterized protein (DUF433 family)
MSHVVISDKDVLGGTRVFRGTRVPVDMIFECLADGMTIEQILNGWPTLSAADLNQAIKDAGQEIRAAA